MDREETLRRTYRAFNERDVDGVLGRVHPDVDWPYAWRHRYWFDEDGLVTRMEVLED